MKTRFMLLTWNIEEKCIFSRKFTNENDAFITAEELSSRKVRPHDIIKIFQIEKIGHRWDLAVWHSNDPLNVEYVSFYSKTDAIFANEVIKKYDNTLKTDLVNIY